MLINKSIHAPGVRFKKRAIACRQLLVPGALGLLVASILAASMSACAAYMVDVGALFLVFKQPDEGVAVPNVG